MNTDNLFHNQDEVMENIMLFSPMPVLQAIQDSFTESILADMQEEDAEIFAESIPVRKSGKSRYDKKASRRKGSALSDQERHNQKGRDRMHGKRHGNRQVKCLTRKRYLEADHYAHVTYKMVDGKLVPIRVKECLRTNIHRDTVPVPEQEPFYVGIYETRKLSDGITCTMEWDFPEAVQGEAI